METQRVPGRLDWDNLAADALELARKMPPGPERNEALKLASQPRCTALERGLHDRPRSKRMRRADVDLRQRRCTRTIQKRILT